jgi:hypothetical protein
VKCRPLGVKRAENERYTFSENKAMRKLLTSYSSFRYTTKKEDGVPTHYECVCCLDHFASVASLADHFLEHTGNNINHSKHGMITVV